MATNYNPDVLNCLANLSNDEVFTPPTLANQVLDLLPQDLFKSADTKFLDPFTKSGVFLREIVKRLDRGLQEAMPDRQKRIDHILHNQVFGIACTELTALLSRRSIYCSKAANGPYCVSKFTTNDGNIIYNTILHTWVDGKCKYCGANQNTLDRGTSAEQYAYQFIHTDKPDSIFNMTFDVICGNPPYQLNVGVEKENYAIAIYNKFVEQAKKLNPRYMTMIIPARWYAGGRGLDVFRDSMLHDTRIRELHDFPNAVDCFPGVDIAGGVCYFLWDRENTGDCKVVTHKAGKITNIMHRPLLEKGLDSFIRQNEAISIVHKVKSKQEKSFSEAVSTQTPFGLISSFRDFKEFAFPGAVKYYTYGFEGYIKQEQVIRNKQLIPEHKVYLSAAYGERGDYPYFFLGKPFYGEPNSCCSQTYLVIGPYKSKKECENVISYMKTKFFRALVMLKKNTQHNMSHVFTIVPIQDYSHPWTDEMLYKKYGISAEEIAFIDSMIRPMED